MQTITIVGCGPGGLAYWTDAARQAAAEAEVLIGAQRLLRDVANEGAARIPVSGRIEESIDAITNAKCEGKRIAVLVSGDPFVSSLGKLVLQQFGLAACRVIPGISSVQAACAWLGQSWLEARILSAHGRVPEVSTEALASENLILILGGGGESAAWIERTAEALSATHRLWIGRDLTLPEEFTAWISIKELPAHLGQPRTIIALQNLSD